jgi:hypothetical protein
MVDMLKKKIEKLQGQIQKGKEVEIERDQLKQKIMIIENEDSKS